MPYYNAGDYYRGGDYYRAGGLLSGIGRTIGRVARVAAGFIPGVGGVLGAATALLPTGGGSVPTMAKMGPGPRPEPGVTGFVHRLIPGGSTGFVRSRRMNAGNAKAARRAIRRIKSVRKMLQSIESQLPRRKASGGGGSRGVITRAEASRALRR